MLLDVNGLAIGYGRHTVCHGISFRLDRGEILSVIGPNGSGKTTLLTTLYRQIPPLAGEIRLLGQGVSDFASRDFARTAAILTTNRPTLSLTTCREIVESGRYPYTGKLGFLSENDKSSVSLAMDEAGVSDLAEMNFSKISDGQKQRVMLAKAFAQSTPLLILDEPTSYLDIRYQTEFWEILTKKVRHDNISVIMSVHELSVIKKISDTVLCLSNGKMQFCDDPMLLDDTQICRLFGADPTLYAKWK